MSVEITVRTKCRGEAFGKTAANTASISRRMLRPYQNYGEDMFWFHPTARTYTGQYSDEPNGLGSLMYYNARYYSPLVGRFLSPDSIVPGAGNPQAFNRYMYVYGNPLKHSDPTGHCPTCIIGMGIGALAAGIVYQAATGGKGNMTDMMIAVTTGMVAGGLIGTGFGATAGVAMLASATGMSVPMAGAVVTGAGVGALGAQLGYTASAGENYNTGDMLIATGVGAAQGAVSGAWGQSYVGTSVFAADHLKSGIFLGGNILINSAANAAQTGLTKLAHGELFEQGSGNDTLIAAGLGVGGGVGDTAAEMFLSDKITRPFAKLIVSTIRTATVNWAQNEADERLPLKPGNPQ